MAGLFQGSLRTVILPLQSLMSGDSWFENSEVLAKHDSARSPYSDVTASFLSTSVVQNDHLNGVSPEASQPGCSHMTGLLVAFTFFRVFIRLWFSVSKFLILYI